MVGGLSSFRRLFWSIHEILSKTHLNRSQTGQLLNMIDEVKDHLFCFICSKSFITCLWSLCVDVEMRVCLGLNHWSCYQDWAGAWPVATAPPYCDDLSPQPRSHDPGSRSRSPALSSCLTTLARDGRVLARQTQAPHSIIITEYSAMISPHQIGAISQVIQHNN